MFFKSPLTSMVLLFFSTQLLAAPVPVAQQKGKVYTLEESIREALSNNRRLNAKRERIDQAQNVRNQARADFLPKFSTTYAYNRQSEERRFRSTLGGRITITSQDNYEWKGTVTQPLFTGFAITSSYRLAELGIDKSEMEVELEKLDVVLRIKEAYFNILSANKNLEVAQKDVEARKSNVTLAKTFYKTGVIPVNDLLKAEVELANALQNLVTARNATRLAQATFNKVLSRPIDAPVRVKDILVYRPEKADFQKYVKMAFAHRPEIKLINISLQQADQQIRLAWSKIYPEINLTYNFIKAGNKPDVSGSPFHDAGRWELVALFSWTPWEWGKSYYEVREKENFKEELLQTKMALEDDIRLELKEAILALKNTEENIPTTKKAVDQGKENLRVNEERYKVHMTTMTEVLDAQTLLTRARVNYYKALYQHNLARARLERAIGIIY